MSEEKKKAEQKEEAPDTDSPAGATESQEAEAVELSTQMKAMEDRYLRLAAEFDNFRKRTVREFQSIVKYAHERLILELLDLRDNFERALSNFTDNAQSFKQGIELIAGQLEGILKKEGVEELEVADRPFDPSTSEAIAHLDSERPEGEVLQVLTKGYALAGRVLRPARVTVSKGKQTKGSEETK